MLRRLLLFLFPLILLTVASLYTARNLKTAIFFSSHDGEYVLIRSFVAASAFAQGKFPLRWSQSLNSNCGVPVFKYFYPLWPWIVGVLSAKNLVALPTISTTLYASTFILSAIGFFLWMKNEIRQTIPSFLGAMLYLWAPYRLLNVYVRGSLESFAYALLPFVLLAFSHYFKKPKSAVRLLLASLIFTAFSLSHNLVFLLAVPLFIAYCLYQTVKRKEVFATLMLGIASVLLCSFFWFPALFNQYQTRLVDQQPEIEGNLLSLRQLIYSPWGYTYSAGTASTPPTGISFSVGISQLIGVGIATVTGLILIRVHPKKSAVLFVIIGSLGFILFLATIPALPVWKLIPILSIIQFPFRLVGILVFLAAIVTTLSLSFIQNKWIQVLITVALSTLSFYSVRNYMRPNPVLEQSVFLDLENHPLRSTSTGISDEILSRNDLHACKSDETIITGQGLSRIERIVTEQTGTIRFDATNSSRQDLKLALSYFPDMFRIRVNGESVDYVQDTGRVRLNNVSVVAGKNKIEWSIVSNRLERLTLLISLLTLGLLLFAVGLQGITKHKSKQRL